MIEILPKDDNNFSNNKRTFHVPCDFLISHRSPGTEKEQRECDGEDLPSVKKTTYLNIKELMSSHK